MGKKRFLNELFPTQHRYRVRFKDGEYRDFDNFTDMHRKTLPEFDYVIDYQTSSISNDGINWRDNPVPIRR